VFLPISPAGVPKLRSPGFPNCYGRILGRVVVEVRDGGETPRSSPLTARLVPELVARHAARREEASIARLHSTEQVPKPPVIFRSSEGNRNVHEQGGEDGIRGSGGRRVRAAWSRSGRSREKRSRATASRGEPGPGTGLGAEAKTRTPPALAPQAVKAGRPAAQSPDCLGRVRDGPATRAGPMICFRLPKQWRRECPIEHWSGWMHVQR